jgi:hypothetical protein
MELPTYFTDYLRNIRPTDKQQDTMRDSHAELRARLESDETLMSIVLGTFIQGSYRRHTGIRGTSDHRCDVDLVVVTSLPKTQFTAAHTLEIFIPFLERYYTGRYEAQDRSWCITIDSEVKLDLVPTAEPDDSVLTLMKTGALDSLALPRTKHSMSPDLEREGLDRVILEAAAKEAGWDTGEPLWIPDRDRLIWERTHPIFQIKWTAEMNQACNGHFGNVVKAVKWWKRFQQPAPKYPKGYPLEHLIGECCPRGIKSVAEGLARTLEEVRDRYAEHAEQRVTPLIADRALPENDVFHRVTGDDFAGFHARVADAASLARAALDEEELARSATMWRELLGEPFPDPPTEIESSGGFTPRRAVSTPKSKGRFA